ncbi:2,3,4,5-tetrahydropyridine-2,6-dicarboxylate N-acetyltransferase, partial [Enterococcus faecium]
EAQVIIRYIQTASKKTRVKVYLIVTEPIEVKESKVFGEGSSFVVFGDNETIAPVLEAESENIIEIEIETAARYSAV